MVLVFKLGAALVAANHGRSLHRARLSGHLPNLTLYEPPLLASLRELTIEPVKGSTSGDPGVGKTELACTLAEARFGEEAAILRIDMSELQERHTVRVEERERVDYTWTVLVTQDTEIEALLGRLTDEIRSGSNGSLVGLYVYGSLVTGDFDKDRSDIDLPAVVDSDVDGGTFDRLDRMHALCGRPSCVGRPYRSGLRACPCAVELPDPDRADRGRQPWRTIPPQGGRKRLANQLVHGSRSRRHPLR